MNNDARRRAIKYYALFMLLSAFLAIVGGVLFFIAPSALPNSYIELSGQILESRAFKNPTSYGPDKIHDIRFRVNGSHLYFFYPDVYPSIKDVWPKLQPHSIATVRYTLGRQPTVWGLSIDGHIIIEPKDTLESLRTNGYWGLALAVASLVGGLVMLRGLLRVLPNNSFKPKPLRGST
jgi:hypothetical protein